MASYPSIGLKHSIKPVTKRKVDISDAGGVRSVDLNETTVYRLTITHPIINATDRDTLLTFYTTNKNNVNDITLAGSTYDTQFASDYQVDSVSGSYFTLKVSLVGVKQ